MTVRYQLDSEQYPTVPCVHDCVIKRVEITNEFLTLIFEDDIGDHDSVKHINPGAKGLEISYHLVDGFEVFAWVKRVSLVGGEGYIKKKNSSLAQMTEYRLEYLYHCVGYRSMILRLWCAGEVIVDLSADYVEYRWRQLD